ncbi:MAG: hypothetical protein Q4D62_07595, partial [Planctomycetia bacterium]|nr:hypothetical protein [Planctomycetia bacterium]
MGWIPWEERNDLKEYCFIVTEFGPEFEFYRTYIPMGKIPADKVPLICGIKTSAESVEFVRKKDLTYDQRREIYYQENSDVFDVINRNDYWWNFYHDEKNCVEQLEREDFESQNEITFQAEEGVYYLEYVVRNPWTEVCWKERFLVGKLSGSVTGTGESYCATDNAGEFLRQLAADSEVKTNLLLFIAHGDYNILKAKPYLMELHDCKQLTFGEMAALVRDNDEDNPLGLEELRRQLQREVSSLPANEPKTPKAALVEWGIRLKKVARWAGA